MPTSPLPARARSGNRLLSSTISSSSGPRSEKLLASLELFGIRLGLERVRWLLERLGQPQQSVPSVLVAGTNGKGSTAALLASMSHAAGYRTGLYTSPHLEAVTERLVVDGRQIADLELARYLEEILEADSSQADSVTYFEALTVAALCYFRDREVELAVLEVGLGGRLDATNACEPVLSLITPIALDHQRHLGTSLPEIAGEKAGILRAGRPAIAWTDDEEVEDTLRRRASELDCPLRLAREWVEIDCDRSRTMRLRTPTQELELMLPLRGRHQSKNLALAVLAAEELASRNWPRLDRAAIIDGCAGCDWPGRLERVPLPEGRQVFLDAAHNPAAMQTVAEFAAELPEPPDLLFGALRDKDSDAMLAPIADVCGRITLTRPRAHRAEGPGGRGSRGGDPEGWLPSLGERRDVTVEVDPTRALETALAARARTLLVCGSTYLVGDLRRTLRERYGVPPPIFDRSSG